MASKKEVIEIRKGADFTIPFRLTKDGVAEPLNIDLGGGDTIALRLPAADNSVNSIELTAAAGDIVIDSDPRGEFTARGDEVKSALLKSDQSNLQNFTLVIVRGGDTLTKNVTQVLDIQEPALQAP